MTVLPMAKARGFMDINPSFSLWFDSRFCCGSQHTHIPEMEKGHFESLADGLGKVFPFFIKNNIPSFNFSLFLTAEEKKGTLVTGRLVERFPLIPPAGSDMSYLQVLHDMVALYRTKAGI